MRFLLLFFLFLLISNSSLFASEADSLLKVVANSKNDRDKMTAYNSLFLIYEFSDTLKAKQYVNQALELAYKINDNEGKGLAYTQLGFYNEDLGNYNKAIEFYKKSHYSYSELKKSKQPDLSLKGEMGMANCYINTGNALRFIADYALALENYLKALKIYESLRTRNPNNKDVLSRIASCNYNMGAIHFYQDHLDLALEYYDKALHFYEETNDKSGIGICYVNMGALLFTIHKDTLALEYEQKALEILTELGDKNNVSNCYVNIGNIYDKWGNYELAIENGHKALMLSEEIGDKSGISAVLGNLSASYLKLKNYNKAIEYALRSLEIAKETGELQWQKTAYSNLSSAYELLNDFKTSLDYYKLSVSVNDSIYNDEKHSQLSKMEAIYQNEKKQKEIEILERNKILQNKEIEKQTFIRNTFIIGFLLVLFSALIIFRNYNQKKRMNRILLIKNKEIEQQKEELLSQSDLLIKVNTLLENKNVLITDSIQYAKRIQEAILPSEELIKQHFPESFIFFKPKDIVSGDFYWFTETSDYLFLAVVDCTGHGVPGAFMSMIGNTLLNEIVIQKRIYNSDKIISKLDEGVTYALIQQGSIQDSQDDGMEISLCRIDKNNKELEIICTNQSVILIVENEFVDVESNIHSIGGRLNKDKQFKKKKISYKANTILYLLSDGLQDQFGGPFGNKFLYKQITDLVTKNYNKTMDIQKQIFNNSLYEWAGSNEQVDDITVIGLKIT